MQKKNICIEPVKHAAKAGVVVRGLSDPPAIMPVIMSEIVPGIMTGPKKGVPRQPSNPDDQNPETGIAIKERVKTKKPSMYKVLLLNDDYTPMEFVVSVLEKYFAMTTQEATEIMLNVHQHGVGICGIFTYEIAETKVTQVMTVARKQEHPLQCTIEKDSND